MFESIKQVQQEYGVSVGTASFLYTLGSIPTIAGFPKSIPTQDIVSIIQKLEGLTPDEAQLVVRWERGDIHRSQISNVRIEV